MNRRPTTSVPSCNRTTSAASFAFQHASVAPGARVIAGAHELGALRLADLVRSELVARERAEPLLDEPAALHGAAVVEHDGLDGGPVVRG
jgi:hypothetical protein